MDEGEVARRFRRSPEMIRRVVALTDVPRSDADQFRRDDPLRPVERRLLRWRAEGAGYDEIGPRFHRSSDFVRRVEALAHYKLRHD